MILSMFKINGGAAAFEQWSVGQKLTNEHMAVGDRVSFYTPCGGLRVMWAYDDGGTVVVNVPHKLLTGTERIIVDLACRPSCHTVFDVTPAEMPEDYVCPEDEPHDPDAVTHTCTGGAATWDELEGKPFEDRTFNLNYVKNDANSFQVNEDLYPEEYTEPDAEGNTYYHLLLRGDITEDEWATLTTLTTSEGEFTTSSTGTTKRFEGDATSDYIQLCLRDGSIYILNGYMCCVRFSFTATFGSVKTLDPKYLPEIPAEKLPDGIGESEKILAYEYIVDSAGELKDTAKKLVFPAIYSAAVSDGYNIFAIKRVVGYEVRHTDSNPMLKVTYISSDDNSLPVLETMEYEITSETASEITGIWESAAY